jgi:tetratricopeptide (TPR) repeat protein
MEVFAYVPHRTRFILRDVSHAEAAAAGMLASGRGAEAAALLERAAQVEPACARVRFLAGLAEASLGRAERAASSFREALRLQPDHREAKAALEELQRSRGFNNDTLTMQERRP